MVAGMTEEKDTEKPEPEPESKPEADAVADLKRGVNLLFRAAKTAAQGAAHRAKDAAHAEKVETAFKSGVEDLQKAFDRLQSDKLEGALKTSLQEIGRAFGNVAQTLEKELRGDDPDKKS
jgi:hypothetical protein